jgi:hypothetical protein
MLTWENATPVAPALSPSVDLPAWAGTCRITPVAELYCSGKAHLGPTPAFHLLSWASFRPSA